MQRTTRTATLVLGVWMTVASAACNGARRPGGSAPALRPGDQEHTLRHDGRLRRYILHVPPAVTAGRPLPVVLAFHGGGGEAEGFQAYAGLDAVADREGFLVVYPYGNGLLPRRLLTWNAGECCGWAMDRDTDDVGFAIAVLDDVAGRVPLDARRVYATGHSNGAMMAYRLAAERADRIAAIVPVAGAYSLERFAPSRPVAVLHIHSVDDTRALYEGGIGPPFPLSNVRSSHRPVTQGLDRWRRNNGCDAEPAVTAERRGTAGGATAGQTATLIEWEGCASGGSVAHWKMTGVGHSWPGSSGAAWLEDLIGPSTTLVDAAEEAWRFVAPIRR